jgi:hypothetical protein
MQWLFSPVIYRVFWFLVLRARFLVLCAPAYRKLEARFCAFVKAKAMPKPALSHYSTLKTTAYGTADSRANSQEFEL